MDFNEGKMDLRERRKERNPPASRLKEAVDAPYRDGHGVPNAQSVTTIPPYPRDKGVKKVAFTLETWKGRLQADGVRSWLR